MSAKEQQFKRIIQENNDRIRRICRYYAPNDEEFKDMYQEVLINIWKGLDNFRGDAAIATWIYRIAVNTSLSYTGRTFKRLRLYIESSDANISTLLDDQALEQKLIKEERFALLQTELNQLSVIDNALMMLLLEGLSMREISEIIGLTEPNVRVRIHRIKAAIKKKLMVKTSTDKTL